MRFAASVAVNAMLRSHLLMHMTPAEYAIFIFGGVRKLARAVKREPCNITRWKKTRKGGTVGTIPANLHAVILVAAKENGKTITADELVNGKTMEIKK